MRRCRRWFNDKFNLLMRALRRRRRSARRQRSVRQENLVTCYSLRILHSNTQKQCVVVNSHNNNKHPDVTKLTSMVTKTFRYDSSSKINDYFILHFVLEISIITQRGLEMIFCNPTSSFQCGSNSRFSLNI